MDSINGYSQEEAAKTISSCDDKSCSSPSEFSNQSNNELENLLKMHQKNNTECLIDLND